MTDNLNKLRDVQRLNGDTYSSYEVVGMIGWAADEIERLQISENHLISKGHDFEEENAELRADNKAMLVALKDMLAWADKPTDQASPSWIIGACHRARAIIARADGCDV
jgi:hypothetical protein